MNFSSFDFCSVRASRSSLDSASAWFRAAVSFATSCAALSVTDFDDPYEQALIRGRVVETRDDNDLVVLDALSQQYLGKPFPRRKWSTRVVYVVEAHVARYYKSPLSGAPSPSV